MGFDPRALGRDRPWIWGGLGWASGRGKSEEWCWINDTEVRQVEEAERETKTFLGSPGLRVREAAAEPCVKWPSAPGPKRKGRTEAGEERPRDSVLGVTVLQCTTWAAVNGSPGYVYIYWCLFFIEMTLNDMCCFKSWESGGPLPVSDGSSELQLLGTPV